MSFPIRKRSWKRVQASSLRSAFRLCKEHGREKKNLSVERIAELLDCSPDALYKWLGNASMPSGKIQAYEHVCGIHLVSDYLAASANRIVISIPCGKTSGVDDMSELQAVMTEAMSKLMRFYRGEAEQEETENELTVALKAVAWHRANVHKAMQPEFDLDGLNGD